MARRFPGTAYKCYNDREQLLAWGARLDRELTDEYNDGLFYVRTGSALLGVNRIEKLNSGEVHKAFGYGQVEVITVNAKSIKVRIVEPGHSKYGEFVNLPA